jgi:hypothetical protein
VTAVPEMAGGMAGVMELVRLLTGDPAVRARIEADPVLRELWGDAAVRQRIQEGARH